MTPQQQTLWLLAGTAGVLAFATLVGQILRWRSAASGSGDNPVIANLNARIYAWWVMVALMGTAFVFGKTGMIVLYGLASFFALREFITLTPTRRGDHVTLLVAFFIVLPGSICWWRAISTACSRSSSRSTPS